MITLQRAHMIGKKQREREIQACTQACKDEFESPISLGGILTPNRGNPIWCIRISHSKSSSQEPLLEFFGLVKEFEYSIYDNLKCGHRHNEHYLPMRGVGEHYFTTIIQRLNQNLHLKLTSPS